MGKLRLSLDALRVTSFDTGAARAAGGTVHAHADRTTVSPCRASQQAGCFSSPELCTGSGCDETLMISCVECRSVDGQVCLETLDVC